jgi:hypothetical protein
LRVAMCISSRRLSTASRNAALQRSEETVMLLERSARVNWSTVKVSSKLFSWRGIWPDWIRAPLSIAVDSLATSLASMICSGLLLSVVLWKMEDEQFSSFAAIIRRGIWPTLSYEVVLLGFVVVSERYYCSKDLEIHLGNDLIVIVIYSGTLHLQVSRLTLAIESFTSWVVVLLHWSLQVSIVQHTPGVDGVIKWE